MKKYFTAAAILFVCLSTFAQQNYSGSYGYRLPGENHPKDNSAIPGGNLVLVKMEESKYRFWLDVLNGPPGWNRGETDGTIIFINDSASFDFTFVDAMNPCILKFKISKNIITINSQSTSFNCGFGNGVNADGEYTRLKEQPVFNNNWLARQYHESPVATVISKKAQLYQDENCRMEKKDFFTKGISLLNISETEHTFYTEFINPQGKFIYGWLKKTAVKLEQSE